MHVRTVYGVFGHLIEDLVVPVDGLPVLVDYDVGLGLWVELMCCECA